MLNLEHARSQRGLGVAVQHRDDALDKDRSVVQFGADQVNGTSVDANASFEGPGVGIEPLECRKE